MEEKIHIKIDGRIETKEKIDINFNVKREPFLCRLFQTAPIRLLANTKKINMKSCWKF